MVSPHWAGWGPGRVEAELGKMAIRFTSQGSSGKAQREAACLGMLILLEALGEEQVLEPDAIAARRTIPTLFRRRLSRESYTTPSCYTLLH